MKERITMETHHKIGLGSESSEATGHVHGSIGACSHHPVDIKDTSGSARPRSSGRGYVTSFSIGSALIIRSFSSKPDLVETGDALRDFLRRFNEWLKAK